MKLTKDNSFETVLYVRSNDQQSLNLQILKGEEYAKRLSQSICILVDRKFSRLTPLSERPGMEMLFQLVQDGLIKTLIVDQFNRISRDTNQLLSFSHFLNENNITLVILDEGV